MQIPFSVVLGLVAMLPEQGQDCISMQESKDLTFLQCTLHGFIEQSFSEPALSSGSLLPSLGTVRCCHSAPELELACNFRTEHTISSNKCCLLLVLLVSKLVTLKTGGMWACRGRSSGLETSLRFI